MYYLINGKFVEMKDNEEKEGFANNDSSSENNDDGLALLGNLSLDGVVSAKGFYLADGSKIPEVVKLPKNMNIKGNKVGLNVKEPESDLHMKGEFKIEDRKSVVRERV